MKVTRVAHIAIAAEQLEAVKAVFGGMLEMPLLKEACSESGTSMAMYEAGNTHVEVLHNPSADSMTGGHVRARGTGYFHICLEVDDFEQALAELTAKGVKVHPNSPRKGAMGSPVVFLDPATTGGLLIELVQDGHHKSMES